MLLATQSHLKDLDYSFTVVERRVGKASLPNLKSKSKICQDVLGDSILAQSKVKHGRN